MTRVLLIDDNAKLRKEIVNLLEISGFTVDTAKNGRIGLERIKETLPDIVLCDLMMPEMDGYETLQAIRNDPDIETLPVLILTARGERPQMRRGMALGADDYITKPCKIDDLLQAIRAALRKRERLERRTEVKLEHLREQVALALPHELRTPLTCIMGYAELLADAGSSQDVTALAQRILGAGERLNRMSENALLYVQLELLSQGRGNVAAKGSPSSTPLHEIVARQARLKARAHGRETDLVLHLAEVKVAVNPSYVSKIVDELVDNAFKFSPAQTPVRISTAVEGASGLFRVSDSGGGMTDEQIADVAGFVQFERSLREQQGLGLGLSIARRVAMVWGGTLSIDSLSSRGTTVTVSLPTARVAATVPWAAAS
jgi:signal transduction histidine kinase